MTILMTRGNSSKRSWAGLPEHLPMSSATIFLNKEQFCFQRTSGNAWRHAPWSGRAGGVLLVSSGEILVSSEEILATCWASDNAQDAPPWPRLRTTQPEMSPVLRLRTLCTYVIAYRWRAKFSRLGDTEWTQVTLGWWKQFFSWTPENSVLPARKTEAGHLAFLCPTWVHFYLCLHLFWILLQWGREYITKSHTSSSSRWSLL